MFGYSVVVPAIEARRDEKGHLVGHYLPNKTVFYHCTEVEGQAWIILAKYGYGLLEYCQQQARTVGGMIVKVEQAESYMSNADVAEAIRKKEFIAVTAGPGLPPNDFGSLLARL